MLALDALLVLQRVLVCIFGLFCNNGRQQKQQQHSNNIVV